jgi:iron complex transport system substrate-binding protein
MVASPRIVSLLPSSTEIVCALGLDTQLVGVSHECDYPASIADRPRLTAANIHIRAESQTIDREVRALVRDGLSIYRIDTEQLRLLQPDVIITQDQCEVCAVPYAEVVAAVRQVLDKDTQVVSLQPTLLQDIWADIRTVGRATERLPQADALLETLFERVQIVMAETITLRQTPRVAVIEWLDPLIMAGNWMPELIQIAGGQDGLCTPGEHSAPIAWETLLEYAPDVLAVIPCGYILEQTLAEVPTLTRLPGWETLPAVRQGRVYAVDGNAYFNRPGPRIVDSLEILAGLIHPELFEEFLAEKAWAYQQLAS